ncbi:hypothetical protein LGH70_07390 [Hymenobacter sp. BT635]|uniref:Uncharacterized protein n=1 Tax=Hymenobacter nitidus TaxID=2880929 RepID=A0ABS8AAG9_9BACT|nr:hypothetical protein [Hymenobacter nitidus]MCB2377398.1 hypothetical protein [Hymenobacter nitidus]
MAVQNKQLASTMLGSGNGSNTSGSLAPTFFRLGYFSVAFKGYNLPSSGSAPPSLAMVVSMDIPGYPHVQSPQQNCQLTRQAIQPKL